MSLKSSGNVSGPEWVKSSYSGSNNNDCIEVAASPHAVRVRDSKNVPGPELGIGVGAWTRFVAYAAGS